ncbi:uncharacterized protein P884DRAFT_254232 [Thermothelomyces heterothallicus CBS 202.75]|uniref:uncharacterized protein n=1 Tax=Thermothelomyces heterothallicus CBS 202.75 TaxID=1149848 RepID=UPI00374312BA
MKLVQYFTSILQFELPRSCRDNNGPALPEHGGRFYACHVVRRIRAFRFLRRPRKYEYANLCARRRSWPSSGSLPP